MIIQHKIKGFLLALLLCLPMQAHAVNTAETTLTYNLGEMQQVKKNNGYAETVAMDKDSVHYGWELGQFFVEDFTQVTTDAQGEVVFLKTVGDKVQLNFNLYENIDQLQGNNKVRIDADKKGYDAYFQTEPTDLGRGALFMQHTNYQNQTGDVTVYTDYLSGITQGANTQVELLEEGDYQVALDYKIGKYAMDRPDIPFVEEDTSNPVWRVGQTDYRIFFNFSVRNGNCMVYPFDVATGQELTEDAITEHGFRLDLAKSRYLDIQVKKEMLSQGANGLVEDVRFNRPAKDGETYTQEGIYTITVKNKYTDEQTVKKIYVGSNEILCAHMVTGLSIAQINQKIEDGATITPDGTLIDPPPVVAEPVVQTESEQPMQAAPEKLEGTQVDSAETTQLVDNLNGKWIASGMGALLVLLVGIVICKRKKEEE